jgi:hypothetical protein
MFFGFRSSELLLRLDWRQKNDADQRQEQHPSCSHIHLGALVRRLFADTALPAVLCAVLAVFAVLAGFAGIGTGAGRRERIKRNLIEENHREQDSTEEQNETRLQHCVFLP